MTDIKAVLQERGTRYGEFRDHAAISQELKGVMHATDGWIARLDADMQEALDMIQHKVARILNGDPSYADSWVDIAGYAQLVADRLEGAAYGSVSASVAAKPKWCGCESPEIVKHHLGDFCGSCRRDLFTGSKP